MVVAITYLIVGSGMELFTDFLVQYILILLFTLSSHFFFPIIIIKKKNKVQDESQETTTTTDDERGIPSSSIIFNDPITRSYMKEYMAKCLQEESIVFWETINELQNIENELSEEQKQKYCNEIYNKFIKDCSECEININASMKSKINEKLKTTPGDISMFKPAKMEMEKLIIDNNFHNFIKSDLGIKAEEVNDWFSAFTFLDAKIKKAIAERVYLDRKTLYINEYFDQPNQIASSIVEKIENKEENPINNVKDHTKDLKRCATEDNSFIMKKTSDNIFGKTNSMQSPGRFSSTTTTALQKENDISKAIQNSINAKNKIILSGRENGSTPVHSVLSGKNEVHLPGEL